jgi:hypothetical protein
VTLREAEPTCRPLVLGHADPAAMGYYACVTAGKMLTLQILIVTIICNPQ